MRLKESFNEPGVGRFHVLACLVIVVTGLIVYSNTIHCSFHFDDYRNIVDNPLVKDLRNVPQFFQGNEHYYASRGLYTTSLAINYYFSGLSVEGYHWVNISIHIMNGILVYFLALIVLRQFISRESGTCINMGPYSVYILALFVALLFLTSPLQTHGVTYICKRHGLMASFFYLLSLIFFIKAVTRPCLRMYLYAGSVLSFFLAIWCKETVCSAPIIMFLYYRCFIAKDWRSSGRGLKLVLPYIALSVVSYCLSVPHDYERRVASYWNWWEYLLTQSNVLIEYVRLLLLPLPGRLNVDADFPLSETLWEFPTLLSGASIAAIVVTAVLLLDRARLVAFSILWFFVTLAPTSSIMPLHEIMVSYRLYLPGVGFYLLLVVGVHKVFCYLFTKMIFEPKRLWLAELAVFMCIVMFYGACAYEHNKVFWTEVLLWEDTVKKSPNKIRPHYGLGRAYHKAGQVDRAREQYRICGRLYHAASDMRDRNEIKCASMACNNLGLTYINAGQYDAAIPILKETINIRYNNAEAHCNLAYCYVNTGRAEAAETEYKLALGFRAKHSQIYAGLGLVYEIKGMPEEAIKAYARAVELDTGNTNAHFRLGYLWLNHSKNPARATYHLSEALAQSTDKEDRKRILARIESMANIPP